MLSRTIYNTILLLIFAFGCVLIHINYNEYLNSICASAIFLSHIYVDNYTKGKSKLTEILPLLIALLTSCILLFFYVSDIQNPTGHQIFLGIVIMLTYVIDLGMIDSLTKQNLEKKWIISLLIKICLCLIAISTIQISGLSWFKIILLFIAFLCTLGSVLYKEEAKATNSEQALVNENSEETIASEIQENVNSNENDDEEDDSFDYENATDSSNEEQQEMKTITKKRKYTRKRHKKEKTKNITEKNKQNEYIGRFIDLE